MAQRAIIGINGRDTLFSRMLSKIRTKGIDGSNVIMGARSGHPLHGLTVTENGNKSASDAGALLSIGD